MLRTALVVLSGAMLVGCEDSGRHTYGDATYHGDVYGNADNKPVVHGHRAFHDGGRVAGEREYRRTDTVVRTDRDDAVRTASVQATPTDRDLTTSNSKTEVRRPTPPADDVSRSTSTEVTRTVTPVEPSSPRASGAPGIVPPGTADPERAAFAATAHYPNEMQASNDLKATALVGRSAGSIKIANASDQPIRDAKLWVDGRYVVQINDLPAHGTVTLNRTEFADRDGKLPADLKGVRQVQLQTKDNLYNLQGPVFDER
jgi:hypothetical protein